MVDEIEYRQFTRAEAARAKRTLVDHVEQSVTCPACARVGLQTHGVRTHVSLVALVCDAYCGCGAFSTRFLLSSCTVPLSEQQAMRDELGPHASKRDLLEVLETVPPEERRAVGERRSANERRGPRMAS